LMVGDAAGLIVPLAGDGIAMALEGGHLAGELGGRYLSGDMSVQALRREYPAAWQGTFGARLWLGKWLQMFVLRPYLLAAGLRILNALPGLGRYLVRHTRGLNPLSEPRWSKEFMMTYPAIHGLGTVVPSQRYSQTEVLERFLAPFLGNTSRVQSIFRNTGVGFRHAVVDGAYYAQQRGTQERNGRYMEEAIPLGEQAIRRCLTDADASMEDIDDFIVVSCTGLDTPGLDLRLAGRLGMRPDLERACVLGMGCYGAFPGLLRARQAVSGHTDRLALVLALELCSLHFQPEDKSLEGIVSSALFSDGAAAVLVGSQQKAVQQRRGRNGWPNYPRLIDSATHCDYTTFEHMAFHLTDQGFHMHLTAYVPDLLSAQVENFVASLLQPHHLTTGDVRFWGVHPGSAKILDNIQSQLALPPEALDCSRAVLYRYGNMSSATVLFVLDEIQRQGDPSPGDYGVLMAFGPGLTLESALVQW
jgi:alkylresorcinol/alkylpyrone synthase